MNDYYVINKKILPDYYEKVVKIKNLIDLGDNVSVACKKVGLARATYYKYKDFVSVYQADEVNKALFLIKIEQDNSFFLSLLNKLSNIGVKILSISKEELGLSYSFILLKIAYEIDLKLIANTIYNMYGVLNVEILQNE